MDLKIHVTQQDKTGFPKCITMLVTGMPKSGKTTNSLKWNDGKMLCLDCEYGTRFIEDSHSLQIRHLFPPKRIKTQDGKQVVDSKGKPITEIILPEERGYYYASGADTGKPMPVYSLSEAYIYIEKNIAKLPYDGYIIDTIDEVNAWIEDEVKKELNIEAMGQGDYGQDWGRAKSKMANLLNNFIKLFQAHGKTLILICHAKQTVDSGGIKQQNTVLPSGMASIISGKSDVIGYTSVNKKGEFTISFRAIEEKQFGSRIKAIAQREMPFEYKTIVEEYSKYMMEGEK